MLFIIIHKDRMEDACRLLVESSPKSVSVGSVDLTKAEQLVPDLYRGPDEASDAWGVSTAAVMLACLAYDASGAVGARICSASHALVVGVDRVAMDAPRAVLASAIPSVIVIPRTVERWEQAIRGIGDTLCGIATDVGDKLDDLMAMAVLLKLESRWLASAADGDGGCDEQEVKG